MISSINTIAPNIKPDSLSKKSDVKKSLGYTTLSIGFNGLEALSNQNRAMLFKGKNFTPDGVILLSSSNIKPEDTSIESKMQRVLSKTKYSGVFKDHHEALKTLESAQKDGSVSASKPLTVLHLDTHSDLKRSPEPILHIGNWVNTAMQKGIIKDFYWILPAWTKDDKWKDVFWKEGFSLTDEIPDGMKNVMLDPPADKIIYLHRNSRQLHFDKPLDYETNKNNYMRINFYKITMDELSEKLKETANLMLDICGDYFVNNGTSTAASANNVGPYQETKEEIDKAFNKMIETLDSLNARPIIYTAAESREFIPQEHMQQVSTILNSIKNHSNKRSPLISY